LGSDKDDESEGLYMSSNGGVEWTKTLDEIHTVVSLDEGSVFVAFQQNLTDTVRFSYAEGRPGTWQKLQYASTKERLLHVATDKGERQKELVILSTVDSADNGTFWNTAVLNFDEKLRDCKDSDYESIDSGCHLGMNTKHWRRNISRCCFNSDNNNTDVVNPIPCPCEPHDFICDWGYAPDGDSCLRVEGEQDARQLACANGAIATYVPTGYRKVPGERCIDDIAEDGAYLPSIIKNCTAPSPGKPSEKPSRKGVVVPIVVTTVVLLVVCMIFIIVYRLKTNKRLIPRLSIQADDDENHLVNDDEADDASIFR